MDTTPLFRAKGDIPERTHAGLEAARARGRVGGRPRLLSGDKLRTAQKLYEQKEMTSPRSVRF